MRADSQCVEARARRLARRLAGRFGYRGGFLVLLGIYDLFYGYYLARGGALQHDLIVPEMDWGLIWLVTGAALIAGGFIVRDQLFFAGAVFVKCAWSMEFFWLAFHYSVPFDWARGAYFLALAAMVMLVSSWPEPPHGR